MLFQINEQEDLKQVLAAADGFIQGIDAGDSFIQTSKIRNALRCMREDFPAKGGLPQASAFKKCANFLCFLVADGPLLRPLPVELVGKDLAKIRNHQNAMIGFHIATYALLDAKIHRGDCDIILKNPIKLSAHSYIDLIQALSNITPQTHFHLVSVLLEQLCYKSNPDASYQIVM